MPDFTSLVPVAGQAAPAPRSTTETRLADARATAEDFEAAFLATLLKTMFSGVIENQEFGTGTGGQNWQELLVDEYAKSFAAAGGVGIADQVMRELLVIQESAQ